MKTLKNRNRRREGGAALAEYGLLVAGITMVSLAAVTVLGSKVGGLLGSVAFLLPGAWAEQNAPVQVGQLIETRTVDANDDGVLEVVVDAASIADDNSLDGDQGQDFVPRLGQNMGFEAHDTYHLYQLGTTSNPDH